jgi:L-rhamnose-H+ transport protein
VPYKAVKKWAWETYWLVGGFFSWIICPWLLASLLSRDVLGTLQRQPASVLWWTYFFGALWGVGGLTFGLTMRYLGMSLGMGVALGYCAAFGTLLPPVLKVFVPNLKGVDSSIVEIARSTAGQVTLAGVAVCFLGIAIAALAGWTKEKEMPDAEKKKAIAEFNFSKGIVMATFSGIMSACFAFALTAGIPINDTSAAAGTSTLWTGLPRLIVVLLGGFTTNFIWCVLLNVKNKTGYQYFSRQIRPQHAEPKADLRVPVLANYLFSALAGATWYFQFFFYSMGETQMGKSKFVSWTLHMASIIIFSTIWGWILHEWKGASKKAHALIAAGIATLIFSTMIIGYGAYLKIQGAP